MDSKKITRIVLIVLSIGLVISALFASTYALYSVDEYAANPEDYTTGTLSIEASDKSDKISLTSALPITDEDGIESTPYVFTIKNNGNVAYKFNVKLNSTSTNTFSPQYIKLKIDDGEVTTLYDLDDNTIKSDIVLPAGESIDISIRAWLSIDNENSFYNTPNSEYGNSFESELVIDGQAVIPETFAKYITNLYTNANKSAVDNGTGDKIVTYNVANIFDIDDDNTSSGGLINDRLGSMDVDADSGNIRYYGANPNNYINFNCETYPDTNCETWRIIGVFGDKVKLIRNSVLTNTSGSAAGLAWDQNINTTGTSGYNNDWSNSSLKDLLNNEYYNGDTSGTVTYYSGGTGATETSLDMTSIGIKNDTTRNMIAEVTYNLGGYSSSSVYSNQIYNHERGNLRASSSFPLIWLGKIALPYPSDYGYAMEFSDTCNLTLNNYSNSTCRDKNWMTNIITNNKANSGGILTPNSGYSNCAWFVYSSGGVDYYNSVSIARGVAPVLYLDSELTTESGDGSENNPYRISVS